MSDADSPIITFNSTLDWPAEDELEEVEVQCAGRAYLAYESRLLNLRDFLHSSSFHANNVNGVDSSAADASAASDESMKEYDLLNMSEKKLAKLNYYQVLQRKLPMHSSTEDIRKAYHKACLKYHPDKTGRGEEDAVFLLVKTAFDTLSDPMKRRSYDSTCHFDESIPPEGVEEQDFYTVYGPVFERNLRFASFNDPMRNVKVEAASGGKKKGKNNKKKNNKNNGGKDNKKFDKCPPFGDDDTPLEQVHSFYEFWVHFESWRDFSLKAEKETDHDLEAADSRDEKRWMKQEIDRKVKKMKKEEMARINLLVERAMAADPRLSREKKREKLEKERQVEAKRKAEEEKAEAERLAKEKQEAEDAKKKAEEDAKKKNAKQLKEQEKKQLRKAKQQFRKLTMAAYQAASPNDSSDSDGVWDDMEKMNDDVELLCEKLSALELDSLSEALGCPDGLAEVRQVAIETAAGAERQSLLAVEARNRARKEANDKQKEAKLANTSAPWTKDELAALSKAIKKYPAGGAARWDAIASFINNLCKQEEPRTKEECIEKYNQIASAPAAKDASDSQAPDDKAWTEKEDNLLQDMLRKYPATLEKNERWKSIAEGVSGRSKKECVERFKAIREAVKKGKN
eukprot:scaffold6046_cov158-Skeletonema_menzelii.AAC.4